MLKKARVIVTSFLDWYGNRGMQAIILDTETHTLNGLPIEIAYAPIQIEAGKLSLDREQIFDQLYSIGHEKISFASMAVHHILESDLEGQPNFSQFKLDRKSVV